MLFVFKMVFFYHTTSSVTKYACSKDLRSFQTFLYLFRTKRNEY